MWQNLGKYNDKFDICIAENRKLCPAPFSVLRRYDRRCISPQSLYSREVPNHRSLQSEMQDVPQVGSVHSPPVIISRCTMFFVSCWVFVPAATSQSPGRHRPPFRARAQRRHSQHHPQDQVCRDHPPSARQVF